MPAVLRRESPNRKTDRQAMDRSIDRSTTDNRHDNNKVTAGTSIACMLVQVDRIHSGCAEDGVLQRNHHYCVSIIHHSLTEQS